MARGAERHQALDDVVNLEDASAEVVVTVGEPEGGREIADEICEICWRQASYIGARSNDPEVAERTGLPLKAHLLLLLRGPRIGVSALRVGTATPVCPCLPGVRRGGSIDDGRSSMPAG